MGLEIKFVSDLNGSTINERTCVVKDEKGKALKCRLRYNEQNKSIQILTQEAQQANTNYYLVISEDVKTLDGGTMGKECQIRFKIFDEYLVEQLTLRGSQCKQFEPESKKEVPQKEMISQQDFEAIDDHYTVVLPQMPKKPKHVYAFGFSAVGIILAVFLIMRL